MDQEPAEPRRKRRAASRAAGPPAFAVPAAAADQGALDADGRGESADSSNAGQLSRRRQRRPRTGTGSPADAPPAPQAMTDHSTVRPDASHGRDSSSRRARSESDRSLRALVTTRPTQLTSNAAMRARDVAAPSSADLTEAAAELVIIRRNYVPPAPLPPARKRSAGASPSVRHQDADGDALTVDALNRRRQRELGGGRRGAGRFQEGSSGDRGSTS